MLADITRSIINNLIHQLREEDNKAQLHRLLVDPTIKYILDKLFPYLIGCAVIFILILLLTIITISLIVYDLRLRKM